MVDVIYWVGLTILIGCGDATRCTQTNDHFHKHPWKDTNKDATSKA